jgi:hypothetical protein
MVGVSVFGKFAKKLGLNDALIFEDEPDLRPTTKEEVPDQQNREYNKAYNSIMLSDWAKRQSSTRDSAERFYAIVEDSIDKTLLTKIRADPSFSARSTRPRRAGHSYRGGRSFWRIRRSTTSSVRTI